MSIFVQKQAGLDDEGGGRLGNVRASLCIAAAVLLSACSAVSVQTAPQTWAGRPATSEAAYLERLRLIQGREQFEYDTMVDVPGADAQSALLPAIDAGSVTPHAVAEAIQYAQNTNSSALLVWHKGKLIAESYFQGKTSTSQLNGKSFPKALSSVAVGRAIALGHIKGLDQSVADYVQE